MALDLAALLGRKTLISRAQLFQKLSSLLARAIRPQLTFDFSYKCWRHALVKARAVPNNWRSSKAEETLDFHEVQRDEESGVGDEVPNFSAQWLGSLPVVGQRSWQ